jgi:uncharacterized protein (DUF952 family)
MIYHFLPKDRWENFKRKDYYRTESLEKEGFIHCSKQDQITEVANFKFETDTKLVLLTIDEERVESEIRYEGDEGNEFPHVYGELNLDSVDNIQELPVSNSEFKLPNKLQ